MQPNPQQRLAAVLEAGRRAEERLARYQDMKEELKTLEARAVSPDRSVTVVAGPQGVIKDVQFTDGALRMSAQTLSRTVLSTIQQAAAEAARRMAATVAQYAGDRIDVVGRVAAAQEEAFSPAADGFIRGGPAADDENQVLMSEERTVHRTAAPAPAPPGRPPADDDHYFRLYGDD